MDTTVSGLIHSADFSKLTDDRLKDEDNVAWVMGLPDTVRNEWLTTLQWVRAPDRLLESQLFDAGGSGEARDTGTWVADG